VRETLAQGPAQNETLCATAVFCDLHFVYCKISPSSLLPDATNDSELVESENMRRFRRLVTLRLRKIRRAPTQSFNANRAQCLALPVHTSTNS